MKFEQIIQLLSTDLEVNTRFKNIEYAAGKSFSLYPRSVNLFGKQYYFIAREQGKKYLYILSPKEEKEIPGGFSGEHLNPELLEAGAGLFRCPMSRKNAQALQTLFDFTRARLIGTDNSVGLGDRLGLANPGHLRAVVNTDMKVILAQQSIRELERTGRSPEEVMDAAIWAVFQEGWREGYGADADHLKNESDIDLMVRAGYTMITIDPGEHVKNEVLDMPPELLDRYARELDWDLLRDSFDDCIARYENKKVTISDDFILSAGRDEILRSMVKYGGAVCHTVRLYRHLKNKYPDYPFELELSVDETDSTTTAFEHYFIVNELIRLNIRLVSLAPRFIGGFEKGIDYRGDLSVFMGEYDKHVKISECLGPYKISYHSGSDKFSVYEAVGKLKSGRVHVKTAGTSYLEALHAIAVTNPGLFKRIFAFSRDCYETEKRSYHVSADLANVPDAVSLNDSDIDGLFQNDDARQVMHVAFGKVLTARNDTGDPLFKSDILNCLTEHEEIHYAFLEKHFKRHVEPFL